MKSKKLLRVEKNKIIAGVCTGLGVYFEIDPVLVRVIFVVLALTGGFGIFLYILLAIIIPADESVPGVINGDDLLGNTKEDPVQRFTNQYLQGDASKLFAIILIGIGIIYFLSSIGLFAIFDIGRLWPLLLIVVGIAILTRS